MIKFCLLLCGVIGLPGMRVWAAMRNPVPVVVSDGGRDIHYFTTSGWLGLREGVVVSRGLPLALTCDFREKVRRVAGPSGVLRAEVVTNTTYVNISFPLGARQSVRYISPTVNKVKGAWDTYSPEATVFFPAVVSATEVQCDAEYMEDGQRHTSVIRISVTPRDEVPVWRRSFNLKSLSRVSCASYEDLSKRLHGWREEQQVVSLMVAGDGPDSVITTVPRTSVLFPFNINVFSKNVTCVVYHVHRPEWGAYVTSYVVQSYVPDLIAFCLCIAVPVVIVLLLLPARPRPHPRPRHPEHPYGHI